MNILVTGGRGQLGRSLAKRGPVRGHAVAALDIEDLDICDAAQVAASLDRVAPALVVNGAAYTAVDRAQAERDRAFEINAGGPATVARACRERGICLLHVSTDYVFDGTGTRPYREDDAIAPLGVYGETKALGERAVIEAGGTVVRTSWMFATGGPSFVQTMLRLAADRPVLRVVADQHGCPTWAEDLADALLLLGEHAALDPIYHFCGDPPTTWHAFASTIIEEGRRHRSLACERIEPITTAEYPTPARRPAYSVLDTTRIRALGIPTPAWQIGMAGVVADELGGP